jgi:tRNA(fMet)-specific endonuclease VapC
VTYLLDTNACIALINGKPAEVRRRFEAVAATGTVIATSSIVIYELWYGVAKSARVDANADRLTAFLGGPIDVLDFTAEDAREAGNVRAALEAVGRPIGAYDLLIAGQARRLGAHLVTANGGEFGRVSDLLWEDWSASPPQNL